MEELTFVKQGNLLYVGMVTVPEGEVRRFIPSALKKPRMVQIDKRGRASLILIFGNPDTLHLVGEIDYFYVNGDAKFANFYDTANLVAPTAEQPQLQ